MADRSADSILDMLAAREAIRDVAIRYASGVDERDWKAFRSCFTDPVEIDFSSWNGVPARSFPLDAWVESVRAGVSGFDATQHVNTNHAIERVPGGDEARCVSYVQARHVLGEETVIVGGYYTTDLVRTGEGWKIRCHRFSATWQEGEFALFARAARRFAEERGARPRRERVEE